MEKKLLLVFSREHPEVVTWKMWIDHLEKGSCFFFQKKSSIAWIPTVTFSTCAVQGPSGGNKVDLSLQDNVEIPYNWIDEIYHVGSSHDCNSIIKPGLNAGGKDF